MEKIIVHQKFVGYEDLFKQYGANDERPDLGDDDGPAHVVDEIWRRGPINAAVKSAGDATCAFDFALPPDSDVDDDASSPFWKAPVVVLHNSTAPSPEAFTKADRTPNTLAKKLGITRTEEITAASGDVWIHAYNAAGELVHARLLQCADD